MEWIVYVIVGIAVGMNLGYMIGVRRGATIVSEILSGIGQVAVMAAEKTEKKE